MSALVALRDDGPLARRVAALVGGQGDPGPLAWLVPPLVRALDYGGILALAAATEPGALPAAFAFLGVLAFHHYDVVLRLQAGREAPPPWVGWIGGGWELRLLAAGLVAAAGVLEPALVVAAIALGIAYVTESARTWLRTGPTGEPTAEAEALE